MGIQSTSTISPCTYKPRNSNASQVSQMLRAASNSAPTLSGNADSKVELKKVDQLLGQLQKIKLKSHLVYVRNSGNEGFHFSANSSWRFNIGIRGSKEKTKAGLTCMNSSVTCSNRKLSIGTMEKLLHNYKNGLENPRQVNTSRIERPAVKTSKTREEKITEHRQTLIKGARFVYGSNCGAAYINNALRDQAGTLRPETIVKDPNAGEVAGFYRRSLEGSDSAFSVDNQRAVAKALTLEHKKIVESLKDSLGEPAYNTYYRGARLDRDQIDSYTTALLENKAVTNTFFMSVSSSQKEASVFTKASLHEQQSLQPVIYVIGGSAREFKGAFEDESLFTPGSQFKVTKMTLQNGVSHIEMTEVKNKQNPIKI